MKKLLIGISLLFVTTGVLAQNMNDYTEVARSVLKTEKKAAIAEVMELTDQESTVFWPLYQEYNAEMYKVNTNLINTINDYAKNYENMTDDKAKELWTESMKIDSELSKLKGKYFKKFDKILPTKKAVRYFQAENKIKSMIDMELAQEIPFFK